MVKNKTRRPQRQVEESEEETVFFDAEAAISREEADLQKQLAEEARTAAEKLKAGRGQDGR